MPSMSEFGDRLRAELGEPRRVKRLGSSPRSKVWWTELPGGAAIVKQITGGTDAAQRFQRELTALRLADPAEPRVVPRLLAADVDANLLVLEYLDEGSPGPGWQLDYATTLARLHACANLRRESEQDTVLPDWDGPDDEDADDFLALANAWGVTVPDTAREELAALVRRLAVVATPALLHGDPCPVGNVLYTDTGVRFIDLEQASIGDGLIELAYLRIGFPTCYSSPETTPDLLREAEAAYRDTWRSATGTAITGNLADACTGWTIRGDALVERAHRQSRRQLRRLIDSNWRWGKASARERLAFRLEMTAECAVETEELAAVGLVCRDLREVMRTRWPKLRRLTAPELNYD